jgi:2'-5' RNA ligase
MNMRLFIAIELPEDSKKLITKVQSILKDRGLDAGWTKPEGIHLTLKFLGEVEETKVNGINTALSDACKGIQRLQLEIAEAGAFPNTRNPRVIWLGVSGDTEQLASLQRAIEAAMTKIGFEKEERKFSPHLTLARIKAPRPRDNWPQALESIKDVKFPAFSAASVSLMKSELKPSGAVYTEIGKIKLGS